MHQGAGEIKARARSRQVEARPGPGNAARRNARFFRFSTWLRRRGESGREKTGKTSLWCSRLAFSAPCSETFCTCAYLATAPRLPLKAAGAAVDTRKTRADDMMDCRKRSGGGLLLPFCFGNQRTNPLLCLCATKGARSFLFRKGRDGPRACACESLCGMRVREEGGTGERRGREVKEWIRREQLFFFWLSRSLCLRPSRPGPRPRPRPRPLFLSFCFLLAFAARPRESAHRQRQRVIKWSDLNRSES